MCGILGYFGVNGSQQQPVDLLDTMADSLKHRGPDSSGIYEESYAGFGFRRLSLIDLSTGDQPILNEDGSLVLICNGEIFNFRELRQKLVSKGHVFRTHSDVEVVLHLYEEFGPEMVRKLNGQFAFAILDRRCRRLMLARDQAGIAPLHYTLINGLFIFASEIKAILKHPAVERIPDLTGLDQVFTFPGILSPNTVFEGISRLQAGHYLLVDQSGIRDHEYWDLDYPLFSDLPENGDETKYIDGLAEQLFQSVRYRLHADVPVGFYLSGGLDSCLTAAFINKVDRGMARHAFSITFQDRQADESRYQQLMASHLNCHLHTTQFDWNRTADMMHSMIYHAECPVKETYNTCSMELSRAAREQGIKAILTGEGADELFAGYVGYRFDRARALRRSSSRVSSPCQSVEERMREMMWGDGKVYYELDYHDHREKRRQIYSEDLRAQFPQFDCSHQTTIRKDRIAGRHHVHQRSYLDFKLRMSDHLLMDHGDSMALANSVEARYPFLDANLIDYARSIPPDLKLRGYTEKYILRRIGDTVLPEAIVRREKFGWYAPGSPEMLRQGVEWIHDMLSPDRIRRQGYFDPEAIESLKTTYSQPNFKLQQPFESDLLMVVATFGLLQDVFSIRTA